MATPNTNGAHPVGEKSSSMKWLGVLLALVVLALLAWLLFALFDGDEATAAGLAAPAAAVELYAA